MKRVIQFIKDTVIVWLLAAFALGYIAHDTPKPRRESLSTATAAQPAHAEPQYKFIDGKMFELSDIAWYTTYGYSFHTSYSCGHLRKSNNIHTSTIGGAIKAGKGDPCDYCAFD